jgi:AraC-like DNA-binding protein
MLSSAVLLTTPHLAARDLRCAHRRGGWGGTELSGRSAVIFARRGSFRRRGPHGDEVIEPGVAYFQRAGEEEEFAHPHDGGDRCTSIGLSEALLAELLGGDPALPGVGPVPTTPRDDLVVRALGACLEPAAAEERVLGLVTSVLAAVVPRRLGSGRPATVQARARIAADAREALAADPALGLVPLARAVAVSPHHLSRVFRDELGVSVTTYRRRLRVRAALERLSAGEDDLARLAADAGFADHAHLAREMRALLGHTPSQLRLQLT